MGLCWSNFGAIWAHLGPTRPILSRFLGQLGAILGHLGPSWAHLGTKSFLETSVQKSQRPGFAILAHFGAHFGVQNWCFFCYVLGHFFDLFWDTFWITLGPFWGPFWDQIAPRWGQDEPKRAIKSFKDLNPRPPKMALKNLRRL